MRTQICCAHARHPPTCHAPDFPRATLASRITRVHAGSRGCGVRVRCRAVSRAVRALLGLPGLVQGSAAPASFAACCLPLCPASASQNLPQSLPHCARLRWLALCSARLHPRCTLRAVLECLVCFSLASHVALTLFQCFAVHHTVDVLSSSRVAAIIGGLASLARIPSRHAGLNVSILGRLLIMPYESYT